MQSDVQVFGTFFAIANTACDLDAASDRHRWQLISRSSVAPVHQLRPLIRSLSVSHQDARPGVHLVSSGLLQLTVVRHQRWTTSSPPFSAKRCHPPGHRRSSLWPHHTSVTAAALAAGLSASRVQDRGARASIARWSSSRVPRWRLSPSVGRCSSSTAVQLQWHAEVACVANTINLVIAVSRPPVLDCGTI